MARSKKRTAKVEEPGKQIVNLPGLVFMKLMSNRDQDGCICAT